MRFATLGCLLVLLCTPGMAEEITGKGHIIFDVQDAIDHLKDIEYWRGADAKYRAIPDPVEVGGVLTTGSLVRFLRDEKATWVAAKAFGGKDRLHQFSDTLITLCTETTEPLKLLPMQVLIYGINHTPIQQGQAAHDLMASKSLKTLLVMPNDSFYDQARAKDALDYIKTAFDKLDPAYTYIYSPPQATWDPTLVNDQGAIHQIFLNNPRCTAVMPRMYWLKKNPPADVVAKGTDFYIRARNAWGRDATFYKQIVHNNSLILQGQVYQEYCDDQTAKNYDCTDCGFYGKQAGPPAMPIPTTTGIKMFVDNFVNGRPAVAGAKKYFSAQAVAFWSFENFNPEEHLEFEAATVEPNN